MKKYRDSKNDRFKVKKLNSNNAPKHVQVYISSNFV